MLTKFPFALLLLLILSSPQVFSAANAESQDSKKKTVNTLWSDDKSCSNDNALFIAIESDGESYKVASCVKYGCRIAIREFGKKNNAGDFRNDPKFHWYSKDEFETAINGEQRRLYLCFTK